MRWLRHGVLSLTAAAALLVIGVTLAADGRIVAIYTLRDVPIAEIENAVLPGRIANDRDMLLGGVGSDLWHGPTDARDEFWMVTDRGPNGQIRVDGTNRGTFPIPEFTPLILRVKTAAGVAAVQEVIPIVGQSGAAVTGLSNLRGPDETPYDYAAAVELPFNASGLDTEGLVRTAAGDFWLCDEYSPSILRVDRTGKVVKRYVPAGVDLAGADYPVAATLPAILATRKGNRGFEGIALSPDQRTLYVVLQSPLSNPDRMTGEASRNTRVLAFDIATERVTAEYVYRFDVAAEFEARAAIPDDMKLSGVVALNATTLLILERTDTAAKLYSVDLARATNILGSAWDEAATRPALEALADPATAGVMVLPKTLVLDLTTIPGVPDKIEGLAALDSDTIAIANDNDFDIGDFDTDGNLIAKGAKSRILLIELSEPLP